MTGRGSAASRRDRSRPLTVPLHFGFFLTGVVTVLLGPLIPELEAVRGVDHAQTGGLFVAQFTASSLGALLSSFHLRRSLVGGYTSMAAGLALLTGGGWTWTWVALALVGLGLGLTIAASNLWVAQAHPERRGAALSFLNLLWGLGAVLCPLLFAALLGHAPATVATTALAGLAALVAISLAFHRAPPEVASPESPKLPPARLATLLPVAAILFLYVGSENAVGGWLVAFADRLGGGRSTLSLLIGSGFWGAILIGRLVAPWWLRRVSERALYGASLALALGGVLTLALAEGRPLVAVGALLTGLGLASLFPLTVSLLAARADADGSRAGGWVFAFGGLGGAVLPWLTGRWAETGSGLGNAFWIPLAALALLALVYGRVKLSP